MGIYDLTEWVYLDIEKVWVCVNPQTENVIALIKNNN
jgi:hypothetical protein